MPRFNQHLDKVLSEPRDSPARGYSPHPKAFMAHPGLHHPWPDAQSRPRRGSPVKSVLLVFVYDLLEFSKLRMRLNVAGVPF